MGCDIHMYAEKLVDGEPEAILFKMPEWLHKYAPNRPLNNIQYYDLGRSYNLFGWLADVRNGSDVEPLSDPRGIPSDASEAIKSAYAYGYPDIHTPSWFFLKELLEFNYDEFLEDSKVTYRTFLPTQWFKFLEVLQEKGAYRIIFWFDN